MPESEDLPVYNARKTPRNRECAKAATKRSLPEMLSKRISEYYVCERNGNPLYYLFFMERTSRTCQFNLCAFENPEAPDRTSQVLFCLL